MGLTKGQILRLVNDYIGVNGGHLGLPEKLKFSYRTHNEFYPMYCELDSIDTESAEGNTTREKFINILLKAKPADQAKIIRGVFKKFPAECTINNNAAISFNRISIEEGIEISQREQFQKEYLKLANELENNSLSALPNFIDSETALKALKDAEILLRENGAQSAVDRVHTTFHAFLIFVCKKNKFAFNNDDSITTLLKILQQNHPNLKTDSPNETGKIMRSLATVVDTLNPIRNQRSLAHPNENLLCEEDAKFVIDIVMACTEYLASKTK